MPLAKSYKDLRVYQSTFDSAMAIFRVSGRWPAEERYGLTDQIRRSSRGVCANLAEAWRKRRYVASFVSKLSDADAEAAETQVWLDFALACGHTETELHADLHGRYEIIIGGPVKMMADPAPWCGPAALREGRAEYITIDSPDT